MKASIKAQQLGWVFNFIWATDAVIVKAWSHTSSSEFTLKMDKAEEENVKSSSLSSSSSSLSSSCPDDKSKASAQSGKMSRCSDSDPSERTVSADSQSNKSKQPKKSDVPNKKKGKHNFKIMQWACLQVSLHSSLPCRLCWVRGCTSRTTSFKVPVSICHHKQGEQNS